MLANIPRGLASSVAIVLACVAAFAARAGDFRQELAASYNGAGQQLFGLLRDKPGGGNIVFSPYSVGSAMAMALAGARGETEREMASVLQLKQPAADVAAANSAVAAILNGYDRSDVAPTCPERMSYAEGVCVGMPLPNGQCPARSTRDRTRCVAAPTWPQSARLRTANALMIAKASGGIIAPGYVALLKDKFGAEVFQNAGLLEVNHWVGLRTDGKIPRLLDRLDTSAPAVIVNAVYFKAAWSVPFAKGATAPADFRLSSTRKVQVPMMHVRSGFAVRGGPGYRAIRLPYNIPELTMTIVLPDDVEGLAGMAQRLSAADLAELLAALRTEPEKPVLVDLPRFKASFRASLGDAFRQLGMKKAFDLKEADFSGMTSRPPAQAPLAIQDVIHQAVIDVTEAGTEAAAATAIAMATASFQPKLEVFSVDRPFLFFISDDVTGAILFQGRVVDPR
jgi:serpin B